MNPIKQLLARYAGQGFVPEHVQAKVQLMSQEERDEARAALENARRAVTAARADINEGQATVATWKRIATTLAAELGHTTKPREHTRRLVATTYDPATGTFKEKYA